MSSAELPSAQLHEDNEACHTIMMKCDWISDRNKHFELIQHLPIVIILFNIIVHVRGLATKLYDSL